MENVGSRFRKEFIRNYGKQHYEGHQGLPKQPGPVFQSHRHIDAHLDTVNFTSFPVAEHKDHSNYDAGFISYLRKTVGSSQNLEQVTTLLLLNLFESLPENRFRRGTVHGHSELEYNRAQLAAYLRDIPCIEVVFHDGDPSNLGKFSNKSRYVFNKCSDLKKPFPWENTKYHIAYVGCPVRLLGKDSECIKSGFEVPDEQTLFTSITSNLETHGVMITYAELLFPLDRTSYLEELGNSIEIYQKDKTISNPKSL